MINRGLVFIKHEWSRVINVSRIFTRKSMHSRRFPGHTFNHHANLKHIKISNFKAKYEEVIFQVTNSHTRRKSMLKKEAFTKEYSEDLNIQG